MEDEIREVEYIEATPAGDTGRRVAGNTILVGVSEEKLRRARDLIDEFFLGHLLADIGSTHAQFGKRMRSSAYLVDGAVIERTFPGETVKPPYSLRICAESVEGGSLPRMKSVADRLGLPVPSELSTVKRYYDLSEQPSE